MKKINTKRIFYITVVATILLLYWLCKEEEPGELAAMQFENEIILLENSADYTI